LSRLGGLVSKKFAPLKRSPRSALTPFPQSKLRSERGIQRMENFLANVSLRGSRLERSIATEQGHSILQILFMHKARGMAVIRRADLVDSASALPWYVLLLNRPALHPGSFQMVKRKDPCAASTCSSASDGRWHHGVRERSSQAFGLDVHNVLRRLDGRLFLFQSIRQARRHIP